MRARRPDRRAGAPGRRARQAVATTRRPTASAPRAVAGDVTAAGPRHRRRATAAAIAEEAGAVMHCAASISFDLPLEEARADQRRGHARGDRLRPRGDGAAAAWTASSTSRPPTSPGTTRGHVPRAPARRAGRSSATPTSRPSGRPSTSSPTRPTSPPVIARPSIVMGESTSGWTPAFNVLVLADAGVLARAVRRGPGAARGGRGRRPGRLRRRRAGAPARAQRLLRRGQPAAGRDACTVDDADRPDREPPSAASARRSCRRAARARARRTPTTRPPSTSPTSTWTWSSTTRARAALLGPAGIRCPHLSDYFPRLIEYAQTTRWGKSPLTREDAQAAAAAAA